MSLTDGRGDVIERLHALQSHFGQLVANDFEPAAHWVLPDEELTRQLFVDDYRTVSLFRSCSRKAGPDRIGMPRVTK